MTSRSVALGFALSLAALLAVLEPVLAAGLSVISLKGESGMAYHFYDMGDLRFGWEIKRPDKKDERIKFCIPAAFTTKSGTVVGIYGIRGGVSNARAISRPIGGAILISGGKFEIFPSDNGKRFTKEFIQSVQKRKASFFQQFQLVHKGVPARFKDRKSFQMRAIVKFADGREGVVESESAMTFKTFNADLAGLGVEDALYTDMGAWDEGWYRDAETGKIVTIGNDRSQTAKQTNWVVFYEQTR
ncbi:MAG: hypothetical protein KC777_22250 [Cyanobacteria bacterium HKST-UBA02]|nr:hypothetical protein [Cyanobacteria bacterium HKST-UBA02]